RLVNAIRVAARSNPDYLGDSTTMRRFLGIAVLLAIATAPALLVAGAAEDDKVLRHIVLYKFKDGLPAADVQEVVDTFAALPSKIDTIIDFEHGTNVSPEGKSEGLTHAFVVTFADE